MHDAGRTCPVLPALACITLVMLLLISCCTAPSPHPENRTPTDSAGGESWMDTPLSDLQGHGTFTIRDLSKRPVIIPVLSEDCPSCVVLLERELDEIARVPGVQDGTVAVVALDLDPAISPGFIASRHGRFSFTGYTAHAPVDMTLRILDDLGPFALDTNQVPVILVCPGRDGMLLPPGLKTAPVLNTSIDREC